MKKWMSAAAAAAALTLTASCALAATADAKIVAPNTEEIHRAVRRYAPPV